MALYVAFMAPAFGASRETLVMGNARASEAVAAAGTGALAAEDGEVAVLCSDEALYVAHGSTPDASATTATAATSARYYIPSGAQMAVKVATGDKFAAAAVA